MTLDVAYLQGWIGRVEETEDVAVAAPLRGLLATLDKDALPLAQGDPVPPAWHWLYFLPAARQSEIGPDGHPRRGGFLPPVPLPRRMWAGSRLEFLAPLRVGQALLRTSRIMDVQVKQGRTGALAFVKVRHEIRGDGELAVVDEQDIVYRDMPALGGAAPAHVAAPDDADWVRRIAPDPVLLFRYSALTFNGHRIHYDRPYVTEVEGYPGLVVHGPLIATLLLDLLQRERPDAVVRRYAFRAVKPLCDIAPFEVCGRMTGEDSVALWSRDAQGHLTMEASAELA